MAAAPVVLGVVSVLATVASTAVAYKASQDQAAAARSMGDYNNKVNQNNANAAQQQAAADAERQRDRARRLSGSQQAAFANSGSTLDSNSDVAYDSAVQMELDAMTTEYKGKIMANRYTTQGELGLMEANNAAYSANQKGMGTLFSGASQAADRSYDVYKQNPKFFS